MQLNILWCPDTNRTDKSSQLHFIIAFVCFNFDVEHTIRQLWIINTPKICNSFFGTRCLAFDHCTSCEQMKRVDTQSFRNQSNHVPEHRFLHFVSHFFLSCSHISFHMVPVLKRARTHTHSGSLCAREQTRWRVNAMLPANKDYGRDVYCYCLQSIFASLFCSRRQWQCGPDAVMCVGGHEVVPSFFAIWIK